MGGGEAQGAEDATLRSPLHTAKVVEHQGMSFSLSLRERVELRHQPSTKFFPGWGEGALHLNPSIYPNLIDLQPAQFVCRLRDRGSSPQLRRWSERDSRCCERPPSEEACSSARPFPSNAGCPRRLASSSKTYSPSCSADDSAGGTHPAGSCAGGTASSRAAASDRLFMLLLNGM